MARKTPIPEAEMAICNRLRIYRTRMGLPRRLFARDSGLDTSIIIRLELGRTALKYGVAAKIIRAFSINPNWLATGEPPISASIPLPSTDENPSEETALFSTVFQGKLRESVIKSLDQLEASPEFVHGRIDYTTDPRGRVAAEEMLKTELREWLTVIENDRFNELVNAIRYAAMSIVYEWGLISDTESVIPKRRAAMDAERSKLAKRRVYLALPRSEKSTVDKLTESGNTHVVKSELTLKNLLARLNSATKEPGMKSKLAEDFGVPLSNVSQWLSGKREPGGETTLRLLKWVEQQERK